MMTPSDTPPSVIRAKTSSHKFPLRGSNCPPHPADQAGALANWSTLYGIMVGPRKQPFAIHRHVVQKIPLLRERFLEDEESIEARTGSMTMADVDTVAFAVAVDFAYKGSLDVESIKLEYARADDDDDEDDDCSEEIAVAAEEDDDDDEGEDIIVFKPQRTLRTRLEGQNFNDNDVTDGISDSRPDDDNEEKVSVTETEAEDEDSILPTYDNLLTTLFELSHSLDYEALANAAITAYHAVLLSDPPSAWSLLYLQRKGLEDSKMFKMMLRCIAAHCVESDGDGDWESHGFAGGWMDENAPNTKMVLRAMAELMREDRVGWGDEDVCASWHDHRGGESCVVAGKGRKRVREREGAERQGAGKTGRGKKFRKV